LELHTQTIILMICMVYLVMHAVIWFALSEQRDAQVILWSVSGLLSGLAIIPLAARGAVSEPVFFYLGQVPMVLGNAGRCLALRMFFGEVKPSAVIFYLLSSLIFLALIIGGYEAGVADQHLQLLFFSFYAVILLDYFFVGYRLKGARRSLGCDLLMGAGLGLSLSQGVRAIGVALVGPDSDIYAPSIDQYVMVLGQFICIPLANIGFLRIFLEERERRRLAAERQLASAEERELLLARHQKQLDSLLREREEIIRQLTLSNKTASMGALVASLAHELNQPLCSIRLNTQLVERKMRQTDADATELQRLLGAVKSENQRAADIIVKLRKLFENRSDALSHFDLNRLIHDCVDLVTPRARAFEIRLQVSLTPHISLMGDQTQLQQVILNLLNNATDALRDSLRDSPASERTIRVETSASDGWLLIKVEDNGIGIAEDSRQSVFELFKSTKADGMGVGLWLSKTVVNAHRGDIRFTSEVGKGTCFEVWLPLPATE
jgi:signal transduction histidine kinase